MLWQGTKDASMNFKEKYCKLQAQKNFFQTESLVCGIDARVVPWRAKLRPGRPSLGSFGIFRTSRNNLHQDCVMKQLRCQWVCCISCKQPWRVYTMELTFECKVRWCFSLIF